MARVFVGIGSNLEREASIRAGLADLQRLVGSLRCSVVYESDAVGIDAPNFYNLAVEFQTELLLKELIAGLKAIETANGRLSDASPPGCHTLDIDLLLYDRCVCDSPCQLPRGDISNQAFVLRPLSELAGELIHPVKGVSLQAMWAQLRPHAPELRQVPTFI